MNNPEEFAAWAFGAGVPDPRGERYPNQPLIPGKCFGPLSKMLWDLGFRHHDDLQTKWVGVASGPMRNFEAWGTTDIKPEDIVADVAAMAVDQFPEVAAKVAAVTPETHKEALESATADLVEKLNRLNAARERLTAQQAAASQAATAEAEGADGGAT
jgi:hypothetical protein